MECKTSVVNIGPSSSVATGKEQSVGFGRQAAGGGRLIGVDSSIMSACDGCENQLKLAEDMMKST